MLTPATEGAGPEPSAAPAHPVLPSCWALQAPFHLWEEQEEVWQGGRGGVSVRLKFPLSKCQPEDPVDSLVSDQACQCSADCREVESPLSIKMSGRLESRRGLSHCPQSDSEPPILLLISPSLVFLLPLELSFLVSRMGPWCQLDQNIVRFPP